MVISNYRDQANSASVLVVTELTELCDEKQEKSIRHRHLVSNMEKIQKFTREADKLSTTSRRVLVLTTEAEAGMGLRCPARAAVGPRRRGVGQPGTLGGRNGVPSDEDERPPARGGREPTIRGRREAREVEALMGMGCQAVTRDG